MTRTIAIIGALNEEIAHIAEALANTTHATAASLDITCGTLAANSGEELSVAATVGGMGLVAAAATTQHLIDVYHPEAIIFSGIAGNLNKRLHINDVVLGGTLRYLNTDMRLVGQWKPGTEQNPIKEFHSDRHLLDVADKALPMPASPISSAPSPPATISWTTRPRSRRSSVPPVPTRWKWKAPQWRRSPRATMFQHW